MKFSEYFFLFLDIFRLSLRKIHHSTITEGIINNFICTEVCWTLVQAGIFSGVFQRNFQTLTSLRRCCQELLALLCPELVPGAAPVSMFLYTARGTAMSTWGDGKGYLGHKSKSGTSSRRLSLFILWHLMVTRGSTELLLSRCLI